jgi:hypothetical protein
VEVALVLPDKMALVPQQLVRLVDQALRYKVLLVVLLLRV